MRTHTTKLTPLIAIESLSGFAGSLVGIFVPIYLLSIGVSIQGVMAFALVQTLAGQLSIIAVARLSRRLPLKYFMIARIPTLIIFLSLLAASKNHHIPLALLAILQGLQFVLYYLPLHVFFTNASTDKAVGKQVGQLIAIPQVFGLAAPLLAGVIAARWGFNLVFAITAALFTASAIPMTALPSYKSPFSLSIQAFRQLYANCRTYFWLEVVENVQEELDLVIWPIVVYLTVQNTVQAGAVSTIIGAGSALFTYLIGRRADRSDKFKLLRLGGLLMLLLWAWRLVPLTPLAVFVISLLVGFAQVLIRVPFNAIIYNLARRNNPRKFVVFREVPIGIARTLVYLTAILVAPNLKHLFWFAIAAYAIFAFMPRFKTTNAG